MAMMHCDANENKHLKRKPITEHIWRIVLDHFAFICERFQEYRAFRNDAKNLKCFAAENVLQVGNLCKRLWALCLRKTFFVRCSFHSLLLCSNRCCQCTRIKREFFYLTRNRMHGNKEQWFWIVCRRMGSNSNRCISQKYESCIELDPWCILKSTPILVERTSCIKASIRMHSLKWCWCLFVRCCRTKLELVFLPFWKNTELYTRQCPSIFICSTILLNLNQWIFA